MRVLESLRTPLALGREAFRTSMVSPDAAGQVLATIERYRRTLAEYDVTDLQAVATTAVREARNRDVLLDSIRRKSGLEVTLLTAGDVVYYFDAYLFFRWSRVLPVRRQTILTAELGAGTSDFSVMRRGAVLATVGLPLGMLRLSQLLSQANAEPQAAGAALREYVVTELAGLRRQLPHNRLDNVVLFSESLVPALGAVLETSSVALVPTMAKPYGPLRLKRRTAEELWGRCRGRSAKEIAATYKLAPDVAETMEALSATVSALLGVFGREELFVVQTSLGEALLTYRLFGLGGAERYDKLRQQLSVARWLCLRHGSDLIHARHVAALCRRLFAGLAERLGFEPGDLNYLLIAAYLHDIGKFVASSAHHRHSEYLISGLNLFRLDEEEVRLIACTARYHRRSTPRDSHPLYMSLSPRSRIKVQKLAALLRVADALDRSHTGKVEDVAIAAGEGAGIEVRAKAAADPVLERVSFEQKKNLLSEIAGCEVRLVVERGLE
jgi:exopolyphosphatase/guanosine-5'-triphosphate,3'-diphosphate pyrophosphatase